MRQHDEQAGVLNREQAAPTANEEDRPCAKRIALNKQAFLDALAWVEAAGDIEQLRARIQALSATAGGDAPDEAGLLATDAGETVAFRQDLLLADLRQIADAYTRERALHYLKRLRASVVEVRVNEINDLNLARWKEYDDVLTDSLWLIERRDTSGAHLGWYWGNFVPQIPQQMMMRYTKKGDWVLDAFAGSGTTLIECRKMGRNGIGLELNPDVVEKARDLIAREPNRDNVVADVLLADSRTVAIESVLAPYGVEQVQIVFLHPPYHDIIRFSDDPRDLSTAGDIDRFLEMFGEVVEHVTPALAPGRYCVVVIGDKYAKGEWIPLGFYCMNEVLRRGFILKSIIVKNFDDTRAKRSQKELWRYRALAGGFYVFKHEYVMVFQKNG